MEKLIIFGETNRQRILSLYNIPDADYKAFQKTNKVLSSKHITVNDLLTTSPMTSYHDTNKRIFIDMIFFNSSSDSCNSDEALLNDINSSETPLNTRFS